MFLYITKHQTRKTISSATNTAAEPISFALADKSCSSIPILSMMDSIAEFINSTTKTGNMHVIKTNFSLKFRGKRRAMTLNTTNKYTSCLKADSLIHAALKPFPELKKARINLTKPFFLYLLSLVILI